MSRNPPWVKDELILALDLYFQVNPAHLSPRSPEVVELSQTLNALPLETSLPDPLRFRNPNGVYMKLCNFLSFDPDYRGSGLTHASRGDQDVWDEFVNDRDRLRALAQGIRAFSQTSGPPGIGSENFSGEYLEAPEGRILSRFHTIRERNQGLVQRRKAQALKRLGSLDCEVCGFSFHAVYGRIGDGFIECHHIIPLAKLLPGQTTRLSDLALVCANCHRILHRSGDIMSLALLRDVIRSL